MRNSGILLHISSLPSPYGIGTFGKAAYKFVDFLKDAKQSYWQILPLGPTSYGDSPYQTFSAFANNPYFIDLDLLVEEKLLEKEDIQLNIENPSYVEYNYQYEHRFSILRKAFASFDQQSTEYKAFLKSEKYWLDDYALFMSIKGKFDGQSWLHWDNVYRLRDEETLKNARITFKEEIGFHKFMQYMANKQWLDLKDYANDKGIKIIGDMPIYVSYDSSDVWANPNMFDLDENRMPNHVAGVPPDEYSDDGQLWGNPLYHWEHLKETNYQWWIDRVKASMKIFDMIRIDHFIGFVNFFSIPYGDENARAGVWEKGPGYDIFDAIKNQIGDVDIIAEDLGAVTEEVRKVLKQTGYPGMKLLQFGYDGDTQNEYFPANYQENVIAYTGTHDNMTTKTWFKSLSPKQKKFCLKSIGCSLFDNKVDCLVKETLKSNAQTAIIPMQDYLRLGSEARMNIPSTLGNNWKWRVRSEQLTKKLSEKISKWTLEYNRFEV